MTTLECLLFDLMKNDEVRGELNYKIGRHLLLGIRNGHEQEANINFRSHVIFHYFYIQTESALL